MALSLASLNSGSNGNCYYVGNASDAVLIDAGISCREVLKRLERLNLSITKIRGILISHEHSDHIRGVVNLSKKFSIPVFVSNLTRKHCLPDLCDDHVKYFQSEIPLHLGKLSITAFPKFHDAADPYSFVIDCENSRVGVFTDIGLPCKRLTKYFSTCDAAFLESNYDEKMLENGGYPYHLKRRIRGGKGHLSNVQALDVFTRYRSSTLSHLILSHLSANNNCPKLVSDLFQQHANQTKVVVAPRTCETELYHLTSTISRQRNFATQLVLQF